MKRIIILSISLAIFIINLTVFISASFAEEKGTNTIYTIDLDIVNSVDFNSLAPVTVNSSKGTSTVTVTDKKKCRTVYRNCRYVDKCVGGWDLDGAIPIWNPCQSTAKEWRCGKMEQVCD